MTGKTDPEIMASSHPSHEAALDFARSRATASGLPLLDPPVPMENGIYVVDTGTISVFIAPSDEGCELVAAPEQMKERAR
jgi:hypothetical protein